MNEEKQRIKNELELIELKFELLKKEKEYMDYAKKLSAMKHKERIKKLEEEK